MTTLTPIAPAPSKARPTSSRAAIRQHQRNDRWLDLVRRGVTISQIVEDSTYSRRTIELGIKEAETRAATSAVVGLLSPDERRTIGRLYGRSQSPEARAFVADLLRREN